MAILASISITLIASATPTNPNSEPKPLENTCCTYNAITESKCISTVDIIAGTTITIATTEDQTNADIGSWNADWGIVDANGNYTAPLFQPPAGFDTVTYTTSGGAQYRTSFYVILGSGQSWQSFPSQPAPGPVETVYGLPEFPPLNNTEEYEEIEAEYVVPEYIPSEDDYSLNNYETVGTTPIVTISNTSYRELPTRALDQSIRLLVAGSTPIQKRKKCAVLPQPSWVGTSCAAGSKERVVVGKTKYSLKGEPVSVNVSASIAGNTVEVNFWKQICIAYWYKDHYKCVNGVWTYIKTTKCTKTGSYGHSFNPGANAAAIALQYMPGDPGYYFGIQNPNCSDY